MWFSPIRDSSKGSIFIHARSDQKLGISDGGDKGNPKCKIAGGI